MEVKFNIPLIASDSQLPHMKKNTAAVVDLGTNTAHLLIARKNDKSFEILFKKRHYVFLAEKGIERIAPEAEDRLFVALDDFRQKIEECDSGHVIITGTEAFRMAENGFEILDKITAEYGWQVQIISGDREAELIYKGVKSIIDIRIGNYVMMDIGGGSVEFIISENGIMAWKNSFPIGIATLHNFPFITDPIDLNGIAKIKEYIYEEVEQLREELRKYHDIRLIGAAGSFEILTKPPSDSSQKYAVVKTKEFLKYLEEVIELSEEERAKLAWIPKERAKYVIMAILLIQVAIELTGTREIVISPYALKEGLVSEYFRLI